jgi:hypothetical protein
MGRSVSAIHLKGRGPIILIAVLTYNCSNIFIVSQSSKTCMPQMLATCPFGKVYLRHELGPKPHRLDEVQLDALKCRKVFCEHGQHTTLTCQHCASQALACRATGFLSHQILLFE